MSKEKKAIARQQVRVALDFKRTFESEEGRRVLAILMKRFDILGPVIKGPGDPLEVMFNDGEKNVIRYIISKMKMPIEDMAKAIEEYEKTEMEELNVTHL